MARSVSSINSVLSLHPQRSQGHDQAFICKNGHEQQISMGRRRSSSISSPPHVMGRDPGRPVKTRGPPHGQGGRRTTAAVAVVHHMLWAAARADPSKHLNASWAEQSGPCRVHTSWAAARPGPDHRPMTSPGMYRCGSVRNNPGVRHAGAGASHIRALQRDH